MTQEAARLTSPLPISGGIMGTSMILCVSVDNVMKP